MDLNKFTENELEVLSEMLQERIRFRLEHATKFKLQGFKKKYEDEINTYELMRVKINNHLGKFGE